MKPSPALREAKAWVRNLSVEEIGAALAAAERGAVRPLVKKDGAAAGIDTSSSPKSTVARPYDHPYFWAPFVLVGESD